MVPSIAECYSRILHYFNRNHRETITERYFENGKIYLFTITIEELE